MVRDYAMCNPNRPEKLALPNDIGNIEVGFFGKIPISIEPFSTEAWSINSPRKVGMPKIPVCSAQDSFVVAPVLTCRPLILFQERFYWNIHSVVPSVLSSCGWYSPPIVIVPVPLLRAALINFYWINEMTQSYRTTRLYIPKILLTKSLEKYICLSFRQV